MSKEKVILAYSGGLDTSVAITWLKKDYDVIAVCMDVGEGKDLEFIHDKALKVGAVESYVIDVKEEFANDYVLVALQAHAYYEQKYPLVSALSRPLISKKLVEIAHQTGATTIAHGCTGKGNDQVRFEVSIAALDPNLKVVAPVREWKWSREEEIQYAKENGVPVPADLDNPYSVDQNLWGRANECGVLENPWNQAPEEAFGITSSPEEAPVQNNITKETNVLVLCAGGGTSGLLANALNKAAAEYNVPVKAAAGGYGAHREMLPEFDLVILAPQVASNYEDMKAETDKLGIKLAKTEGAQYIKLTRDGQGALAFVQAQFEE